MSLDEQSEIVNKRMPLFTIQQRYKHYFSCCISLNMCVFFAVRIYHSALFSSALFFCHRCGVPLIGIAAELSVSTVVVVHYFFFYFIVITFSVSQAFQPAITKLLAWWHLYCRTLTKLTCKTLSLAFAREKFEKYNY